MKKRLFKVGDQVVSVWNAGRKVLIVGTITAFRSPALTGHSWEYRVSWDKTGFLDEGFKSISFESQEFLRKF